MCVIDSHFELIIGLPDTKYFSLTETVPSQFTNFMPTQVELDNSQILLSNRALDRNCKLFHESTSQCEGTTGVYCSGCIQTVAATTSSCDLQKKSEIVDQRDLSDYIQPAEDGIQNWSCPWDSQPQEEGNSQTQESSTFEGEQHEQLPQVITNDTVLKSQILAICREFQDIFRNINTRTSTNRIYASNSR